MELGLTKQNNNVEKTFDRMFITPRAAWWKFLV